MNKLHIQRAHCACTPQVFAPLVRLVIDPANSQLAPGCGGECGLAKFIENPSISRSLGLACDYGTIDAPPPRAGNRQWGLPYG